MALPFEDDPDANKQKVVRDYLMNEWQKKNAAADTDIKSAQDRQSLYDIANIGGDIATQMSNSKNRDAILYNSFNRLGDAPKVIKAEDDEWDPRGFSELGRRGVEQAQGKKKMIFDDLERGEKIRGFDRANRNNERDDAFTGEKQDYDRWEMTHTKTRQPAKDQAEDSKIAFETAKNKNDLDRMPLENAQQDRDWKHKNLGADFEDSGMDPNSKVSSSARLLYQNVLMNKAQEADFAASRGVKGAKEAASQIRAMAKSNQMSAREAYGSLPMLKEMSYKEVLDSIDKDRYYAMKAKEAKEKGSEIPIDVKGTVNELSKKNGAKLSIANQIDSALKVFNNEKDPKQKVALGKNMIKTINGLEGPDAVGVEEVKRLGNMLEFAYGNFNNDNPMQFGRDLEGFSKQVKSIADGVRGGVKSNRQEIDRLMQRTPDEPRVSGKGPGKAPARRHVNSIDDL